MSRHTAILVLVLLAASCGKPRGVPVENMPSWMDKAQQQEMRLDLVDTLIEQKSPAGALAILAQLRSEKVKSPLLDLYHGQALYQQGLFIEAEALLRAADQSMPRDPRPHRALGLLLSDTGRVDEAITQFQEAVALEEDAATWNNLGFMLHSQRRHDEAIPALQRAISLDGTQVRYRNNLGFALAASGQYEDALETFMSVGNPADAHANLGTALELAGDPDGAAEHYSLALEYNPTHASAQEAMERVHAPPEVP